MQSYKGYALITGASSGIGAALSFKLAKEGYNLILVGRNVDKLEKLSYIIDEIFKVDVLTYKVDIIVQNELEEFLEKVEKINLPITMFVNNAGVGSFGNFTDIEISKDLDIIDLNIRSCTLILKKVLPLLRKQAVVLQVASTAAFAPGPYMAVYYASKAYILSLSLALRVELEHKQIQVNILCPGPTKTNFQVQAGMNKAKITEIFAMSPIKVATIAYNGVLKNKPIIITGYLNQVLVYGLNFVPKTLKGKLVAKTQKI